jgi:hypothetical protein
MRWAGIASLPNGKAWLTEQSKEKNMSDDEHVAPQDAALRNSEKSSGAGEPLGLAPAANEFCYWNDKKYSDGSTVCDAYMRYKCWSGKWVDIGNC